MEDGDHISLPPVHRWLQPFDNCNVVEHHQEVADLTRKI
jgi:hypothetical protein